MVGAANKLSTRTEAYISLYFSWCDLNYILYAQNETF